MGLEMPESKPLPVEILVGGSFTEPVHIEKTRIRTPKVARRAVKKMVFDLEEIKMIRDRIREINKVNIEDVDFRHEGKSILSDDVREEYRLAGLSTFYFLKSSLAEVEAKARAEEEAKVRAEEENDG